jgi:hypothetical protein
MFLQSFDKILSIIVFLCAPIVSPITAFMFCMGTSNFKNLNTIYKRYNNNDIHNVIFWLFYFSSAIIFYFLDAPLLNFLYQIFLGIVIQYAIWMLHNYHKKKGKPHLFVTLLETHSLRYVERCLRFHCPYYDYHLHGLKIKIVSKLYFLVLLFFL